MGAYQSNVCEARFTGAVVELLRCVRRVSMQVYTYPICTNAVAGYLRCVRRVSIQVHEDLYIGVVAELCEVCPADPLEFDRCDLIVEGAFAPVVEE